MKKTLLKSLLYTILLAGIVSLASCKDDYPPISLAVSLDGNSISFTDEVLVMSPYSAGVSFRISGGDGMYLINNLDTAVIDYRYNGNELTVIPVGLGDAELVITDHEWNKYTLQVSVAYPETIYEIGDVEGVVYGADLTQSQTLAIRTDIETNAPVQAGGKYVFTYTDKGGTSGIVTIYPSASSGNTLHGIFTEKIALQQSEIHIELTDGSTYNYILEVASAASVPIGSRTGIIPARVLWQDVTETYRSLYPALEKAYCVQHIPSEGI